MKDLIVPPLLAKIVKEICDQKSIKDYEIVSISGNAKGEGFLSDINFVALKYNNTPDLHNFVIKVALSDSSVRSNFPIRDSFINEIYFYNKVWPELDRLQIDRKVNNTFECISNCFASSYEDDIEYLALENLKESGFEVFPKNQFFDAEHLEFVCKEYGRFHALSFAYRTLYPEKVAKLGDSMIDVIDKLLQNDLTEPSFMDICKVAGEALTPGVEDHLIEKLEQFRQNIPEMLRECSDYRGKNGVFAHGDCWSNNLMFKYNDARKLTNIKLIDFQLTKLGSPVHDLSYCLYSGGSPELYKNFDKYLHIYYNSYCEFMQELNCDPNVFSFADLKSEWKEYTDFGFLISLNLIKIKLTKSEDVFDLKDMKDGKMENIEDSIFDKETFFERVKDLLVHRDEVGCL